MNIITESLTGSWHEIRKHDIDLGTRIHTAKSKLMQTFFQKHSFARDGTMNDHTTTQ